MIVDTLVELLGFSAEDPAFWMPLVFMGLLFSIIVAAVVLDGFDIGVVPRFYGQKPVADRVFVPSGRCHP